MESETHTFGSAPGIANLSGPNGRKNKLVMSLLRIRSATSVELLARFIPSRSQNSMLPLEVHCKLISFVDLLAWDSRKKEVPKIAITNEASRKSKPFPRNAI